MSRVCPEWNMVLITAYGRSPGDLLRDILLFLILSCIFSGWPRVARFMVALCPLHCPPKYPRSRYMISSCWDKSI